jgi:hypothetical protein
MDRLTEIVQQIELHSPEGIRRCFEEGIDPKELYKNEPLIYELTSEYTRSTRFKDCVKAFVDYGLEMEDKALLSVLLDDAAGLENQAASEPGIVHKTYSLRCAYTQMVEVTLLHICAEFNHVNCATVLVKHAADINARAGKDEYGFGSQTAIFHTVNQNGNQSAEMLHFLLDHKADTLLNVPGIIWGKGYEWETLIPAVNPVSYAMMGLLPQVHRNEETIVATVKILLEHAYGIKYHFPNTPNQYLK